MPIRLAGNSGIFEKKRMIDRAVIPAAGRGTRLLPVTKSVPKEMLPIAGKPMIHLCIEEAVAAGIEKICIILNPRKALVRDYIRNWSGLEYGDTEALRSLKSLLERCSLKFVWQKEPRGLADDIDHARDFVGSKPFAMLLPDNVVLSAVPAIKQIERTFIRFGLDTVGVTTVPASRIGTFNLSGKIGYEKLDGSSLRIKRLYPKRKGYCRAVGRRPVVRTFARAIFLPHFFDYIDIARRRVKGELDDGPVLKKILREKGAMGHMLKGMVFDVGNPRGYAAANEWILKSGC